MLNNRLGIPFPDIAAAYEYAVSKGEPRERINLMTKCLRGKHPDKHIYPQKVRYWVKKLNASGIDVAVEQGANILTIDIETAPSKGFMWGLFNQFFSLNQIVREGYVLCVCAKWLGSSEVMTSALPDYPRYEENPEDDTDVVAAARAWLDEADVVIGHNGKRFDMPTLNYRMFVHGMLPPSPYKQVDTLLASRRAFKATSHKLDWLTRANGQAGKRKMDFDDWVACMNGDKDAWHKMVTYCAQDVVELEELYMDMRPWIDKHPNLSVYTDIDSPQCGTCLSTDLVPDKPYQTNTFEYPGFRCNSCGSYHRGRHRTTSKEKAANTIVRSAL